MKHGEVVMSGIHTYGETVHLFIERKNYNGAFMPGLQTLEIQFTIQLQQDCSMLTIALVM